MASGLKEDWQDLTFLLCVLRYHTSSWCFVEKWGGKWGGDSAQPLGEGGPQEEDRKGGVLPHASGGKPPGCIGHFSGVLPVESILEHMVSHSGSLLQSCVLSCFLLASWGLGL